MESTSAPTVDSTPNQDMIVGMTERKSEPPEENEILGACRICGWMAMFSAHTGGLCIHCFDIKNWAQENKRACDAIHRGVWKL